MGHTHGGDINVEWIDAEGTYTRRGYTWSGHVYCLHILLITVTLATLSLWPPSRITSINHPFQALQEF